MTLPPNSITLHLLKVREPTDHQTRSPYATASPSAHNLRSNIHFSQTANKSASRSEDIKRKLKERYKPYTNDNDTKGGNK